MRTRRRFFPSAAFLPGLLALKCLAAEAPPPPPVAFVGVSVLAMTGVRALPDQTVLVRDGKIEAMGPAASLPVPPDALVVEGKGRTLLPGLVESHAHLDSLVEPRPDFGDGPLFLAYGVTTVVNLRGQPAQLAWKRRLADGSLLGPSLYTSGEFVNEPRVRTPAEVEAEVLRQKRDGYDLVKFRQVVDDATWETLTTVGLPLDSYLKLCEVARREGMPLVGHAPDTLGLDALLESGQALAHSGEMNVLWFLPSHGLKANLLAALAGILALALLLAARGVEGLVRRLRKRPRPEPPLAFRRAVALSGWVVAVAVTAAACGLLAIPGGLLYGSRPLLVLYTLLGLALAAGTLALLLLAGRLWRDPTARLPARAQAALLAAASLAVAVPFATHWVPVAWRSTDAGIRDVARACRKAGVEVMTTTVPYQMAIDMARGGTSEWVEDPASRYVPEPKRKRWVELGPPVPPPVAALMSRYPEFTRKLVLALHHEGVPLMAGTDVYGLPILVPGRSLHQELRNLELAGIPRLDVLRSATVEPARFLGKEREFGAVAPGMRADLLLVAGDPLADLSVLERPDGVMVRGTWLPAEKLRKMLDSLKS